MKKKNRSIRILCLLLAFMTVLSVFPMSVSAACSHTHTTKVWDSSISTKATGHQYMTHCNDCGEDIKGWGKSGWESHSFGSWIKGKRSCTICGYSETCSHNWQDNYNGTKHCTICGTNESAPPHSHTWSDGKCSVCGYTCSHLSKNTQWTNSGGAPTSTGHGYNTVCSTCGKVFTGTGYSGWTSHSYGSWSGGKHSCTVCGYSETCSHSSWSSWVKSTRTCKTCGMTETCTSHHWQDNYNGTKHCTICGITESAPPHTHTWSDGKCTECGYTCSHTNKTKTWTNSGGAPTSTGHGYNTVCDTCGKVFTGSGYSGWTSHTMVNGVCSVCGWRSNCSHSHITSSYDGYIYSTHTRIVSCDDCDEELERITENHTSTAGPWEYFNDEKHRRTLSCGCGYSATETVPHNFVNGVCSDCGFEDKNAGGGTGTGGGTTITATVAMSASGPSGTLGNAGGEIAATVVPASYTVTAVGNNCNVTKIVYVINGKTKSVSGSSVTITASTESEFYTTTFTAYTDDPGVTGTMTVNFKYEKKGLAYVMWETSDNAVIRSITGDGLNKTLSYSMTLPNSYDSQGNLSAGQVAAIQSLIGRNDGKTYTVKYTRSITVYTPAELSDNGQKKVLAVYDGNSSSDIASCLAAWGWSDGTKEAIRQAASSSLTFTTSVPVSCTAVWVNTVTSQQLYSMDFGEGKTVNASSSANVSVAYTAYSNSGNYTFESLSYSGDNNGTSVSKSYSQTYTVNSKPLTVTFYCHPVSTDGSITVTAVDGDTNEIIPTAAVKCGDLTGDSNPKTFTGLVFQKYTVSASAFGFSSAAGSATITKAAPSAAITLKLYRNEDYNKPEPTTGTITVYVKDKDTNVPIPGASVSGSKSGTTNTSGYVTFSDMPFGTYSFTGSKTGYENGTASGTISNTSTSTTVTIYLEKEVILPTTGSITVYVRDKSTNAVISGATISGSKNGTTNTSGYVSFMDIPFGSYTFTAAKTGYESNSATASISSTSTSATVTIYLTILPTTGTITVFVRDKVTNALISNAAVSGDRTGTTNSSGSVVFSNVPFGSYSFTASKAGYYDSTASGSISLSKQSTEITIYLTPRPTSGDIIVLVKDKATGTAINGASVTGKYSGTTNSAGNVTFTGIPFGSYTFTAEKTGYNSGSGSATISETALSKTITIYLEKISADVSITANPVNGTIYRGSTIIVSANVNGDSKIAFTPDHPLSVKLTATRNGSTVFSTQTKSVICPKADNNLVWFKVTIPETGWSSDSVKFTFTVSTPSDVTDSNAGNNTSARTETTVVLPARSVPDPSFSLTVPAGFSNVLYTQTNTPTRTWSVWEWNGNFVKKNYSAKLTLSASLTPDETAVWKKQESGMWKTRSGYGLNTAVSVSMSTLPSDMISGSAKVNTYFPEFNYTTDKTKSNMLEKFGSSFVFPVNLDTISKGRMHMTPMWFPDGTYAVKYEAYDLWTPAGMLTGTTHADIQIEGSLYDDHYTS